MNKALVVAVVALVVAVGSLVFPRTTEKIVETVTLGSGSGQNTSSTQFFDQSLVDGGGCFATSSSGIIPVRQLELNSCISMTALGTTQPVISLTLPASTTMSALLGTNAGACREWWIDASMLSAATTTTFVAGTGWDIVGLDATGAGTGADVIDGLEQATLKVCRQRNGDVTGFIQEYINAD